MKKLIFAASGWKKLQKDYMEKDLRTLHVQRLHKILAEDLSGSSFEEVVIHYYAMSLSARMIAVAGYMQEGTLEHAACCFRLASLAEQTGDRLLMANPHKRIERAQEVQMDRIAPAVLSGCIPIALDKLDTMEMTIECARKQSSQNRKSSRQDERCWKRISLEIELYKNMLLGHDAQARQMLPDLSALWPEDSSLQVMRAFFDQNDEAFSDALIQHMREFRSTPYPEELNDFVLFMEALYQKRKSYAPLDLADAPVALLRLPACDLPEIEDKIGIQLPSFSMDALLRMIDKDKIGPKFKQY